jgi:hypothetical protein
MKLLVVCLYGNGLRIHTVCSEECDGSTVSASTTSTTNAVDIVLRVVRVVIVEHVSNVADILKSKG